MSRFAVGHLAALFLATVAAAAGATAGAADVEHTIPGDPAANVVVLDSTGGFRAPPAGGEDDFALCVKADGTASIRTHAPGMRQTWRMPAEDVQQLLRFLLDEQNFFALQSPVGNVKAGPGAQAPPSFWVLTVTADGKTHTVRGPMMRAGQAGKNVERFQQCIARLRGVMAVVAVGGAEPANRFLKAANDLFAREWPGEKPLTLADLASGSALPNGGADVVFVRGTKTIQARSPAADGPIECTVVGR